MCLRTTSRDILGLCKLLKIKSPLHEESFSRKPQGQEFAPEPVTTQRPPKPDKFRIKLPKQVKPQKRQNIKEMSLNAKKMAFKEHMLEKYRKAKIRKAQEKYEMAHKLRTAQVRAAKEKEEHLFFQSNSFRRRKAFPSVIDSLKDSVLSILPSRTSKSKGYRRKNAIQKYPRPSSLERKPSEWKQKQSLQKFKEKYRKEILERPKTVKTRQPFLESPPGKNHRLILSHIHIFHTV